MDLGQEYTCLLMTEFPEPLRTTQDWDNVLHLWIKSSPLHTNILKSSRPRFTGGETWRPEEMSEPRWQSTSSSSMLPLFQSLIHIQEFSPNIIPSKGPTSLTQGTWVWANSRRWWRTGKPGVLQSMGLQRVGLDLVTEQQQRTRGSSAVAVLPSIFTLSLSHMTPSQWPGDHLKWPVSSLFCLKGSQDGFWASEGLISHQMASQWPKPNAPLCQELSSPQLSKPVWEGNVNSLGRWPSGRVLWSFRKSSLWCWMSHWLSI